MSKTMLLPLTVFAAVCFSCLPIQAEDVGEPAATASRPTLRVLNWEGYIDLDPGLPEDLPIEQRSPSLAGFAKQFNCNVEYHEYGDFNDVVGGFMNLPGFYDVVVLSCNNTLSVLQSDLLLPIPREKLPNARYLNVAEMADTPDPKGTYLIPFLDDYVGLAYLKDKIPVEDVTWTSYFDPPDGWRGNIGVLDASTPMFAAAAIANGVESYNQITDDQMREAKERLKSFFATANPQLLNYTDPREQILKDKRVWILPAYSPTAHAMILKNDNIGFVIPPEGSEYYRDYLVIHRQSQNPELAMQFINYMIEPEVAGRIAAFLGADVPSPAAREVKARHATEIIPSIYDAQTHELRKGLHISYNLHPKLQGYWLSILAELSEPQESTP